MSSKYIYEDDFKSSAQSLLYWTKLFIIQNSFTGLQYNPHSSLWQLPNVLVNPVFRIKPPSLLSCLITRVISVEASSIVAKRFPRSVFFNLGNVKIWWTPSFYLVTMKQFSAILWRHAFCSSLRWWGTHLTATFLIFKLLVMIL